MIRRLFSNARPRASWVLVSSALVSACGEPARDDTTLLDVQSPEACAACHPGHFAEWSGSMHAYASKDPVFLAMEQRGQRETGGELGDFCVQCHAPLAVRTGWTEQNDDLLQLPEALQGVNCVFCHSVDRVDGIHNNPLRLREDGVLMGPISAPVDAPHPAEYSALHDRGHQSSSALCGTCHDVTLEPPLVDTPVALERTHEEWKGTLFNAPASHGGLSCGACHMPGREGPAALNGPLRTVHDHSMPGVDVAITPFPEREAQLRLVQESLDSTLRTEVCVAQMGAGAVAQVTLENMTAGHSFPSGAAMDRRLWVELRALRGSEVLLESGGVADDEPVAHSKDPLLWLFRDETFRVDGTPAHMFWEVASGVSRVIPGPVTLDPSDPRYLRTHVSRRYPRLDSSPNLIPGMPDRVEVRVRLRPVALEVAEDLVATGDLLPELVTELPTFTLIPKREGPEEFTLVWTPAAAEHPLLGRRQELEGAVAHCYTNAIIAR